MGTAGTVTWLHLSDLHLCKPRNGVERGRILKALLADLKKLREEEGLRPELLFITGDLAFGHIAEHSLPAQYQEVQKFIDEVRNACDPPIWHERVFLVPGNHDVNRDMSTPPLRDWLQKAKLGSIEDMVRTANKQWRDYFVRLNEYRTFLETNGYTHLLTDPERLIYACPVSVNGVTLVIVGLNSAWAAGESGEHWVWCGGRPQIDLLFDDIERAKPHLKIALMHHPTRSINGYESPKLHQQLTHDFDFCLHGHEHLMFLDVIEQIGHHRLAAGATYQGQDEQNSYNIARINLEEGKGAVWMRRWEYPEWIEKNIPPYTKRGVWHLDRSLIPSRERFVPEEAVRQSAAICAQRTKDGVRFLLTLTSKKRWLFPKGRVVGEPAPDVAANAARIEARAVGKIGPLLGTLDYKRGTNPGIKTAAYFFEVEELLVEEEEDRKPTWHTMEDAFLALMKDREPHEWRPWVNLAWKAWSLLMEKPDAHCL